MVLLCRCYFCSEVTNHPVNWELYNGDDLLTCEKEQCYKYAELLGGKKPGFVGGSIRVTSKEPTN